MKAGLGRAKTTVCSLCWELSDRAQFLSFIHTPWLETFFIGWSDMVTCCWIYCKVRINNKVPKKIKLERTFSVFLSCITSFGDCSRRQHQETTNLEPVYMEVGEPQTGTWGNVRPSSHLLCKRGQTEMRDYMDRRVTPHKRVTSPTWGPPPPCKQALRVFEALQATQLCQLSYQLWQ